MAELIFNIREQFENVHGLADRRQIILDPLNGITEQGKLLMDDLDGLAEKGKLIADELKNRNLEEEIKEELDKLNPMNLRKKTDHSGFKLKEKTEEERWKKVKLKTGDKTTEERMEPTIRTDKGVSYYGKDPWGRFYFLPVKLGDIALPLPVISVDNRKTIIETHMVNRSGSVKGYINNDDYRIRIRGIFHQPNTIWPEQQIKELTALYQQNKALPIENALTSMLGINFAVITSFAITEPRGKALGYTMELLSDEQFTLIVES